MQNNLARPPSSRSTYVPFAFFTRSFAHDYCAYVKGKRDHIIRITPVIHDAIGIFNRRATNEHTAIGRNRKVTGDVTSPVQGQSPSATERIRNPPKDNATYCALQSTYVCRSYFLAAIITRTGKRIGIIRPAFRCRTDTEIFDRPVRT